MATVSELHNTTLSGLNHIDALLDAGPDWNYLTPVGNTIYFTFSVTSGNESGRTGQEAFTASQQEFTRYALRNELARITGINFVETSDGTAAQIHFANLNIAGSNTTGLCSWNAQYSYDYNNNVVSYDADAYVYLDNAEWYAQNRNLAPGGYGYETLLHELGHAMGLKHPFDDDIHLPQSQDNTGNTLMSYTDVGAPHSKLSLYDVAALRWLYGGDGLRGQLGINSTQGARYLTGTNGADHLNGTAFNDKFEGNAGNDFINGGDGYDTVVFSGALSEYTVTRMENGTLLVSGSDGNDTLSSIEYLQFSDGGYERADIVATATAAPTLNVAKNANGYAMGNAVLVTGSAPPNSTVTLYLGAQKIGTIPVDSSGLWTFTTAPLADGDHYSVSATATDATGNTSSRSSAVTFKVDAHAPFIPTSELVLAAGANQPVFSGTAEAGTLIQLVRVTDAVELARTVADEQGNWKINNVALPNGDYDTRVVSVDLANNATSAATGHTFSIASQLNADGDAGANTFTPGAGNNAIDGKAGFDVAAYAGARAGFEVTRQAYGYAVNDTTGTLGRDTLVNVERIKFSDGKWVALDIDGAAGQVYRLYQAAFDRVPDARGFSFWLDAMDDGYSLLQIANEFLGQKEFISMYMSDPSDLNFVTKLYNHVLHRAPEQAGLDYWLESLKVAHRSEVLAAFTESPENQAQVIGSIQHGIEYTPWA